MKKQRREESEKRREKKRREEERRSEKRKSQKKGQKKDDAGARKGRKVANHCVFSHDLWFLRVEKYNNILGLLKRRAQGHLGRWEMKNCTLLWHEADFKVEMLKKHPRFGPLLAAKCTALWRGHFCWILTDLPVACCLSLGFFFFLL